MQLLIHYINLEYRCFYRDKKITIKKVKNMKNDINKNMEKMKKVIEERKAKSSSQKNSKRASTYGSQSSSSGNGGGLVGKNNRGQ
ncbi:MAG: hypothetical protein ACJAX4_000917 [Clostridium sp.]